LFKKIHVFRIKPGQELSTEIDHYCNEHNISSGIILGIIGSLKNATISYIFELPAKYKAVDYEGILEIVSAQGSIALKDSSPIIHIHIQISNEQGCYGGHLVAATIFSTAEVVIGELDYQLQKKLDDYTGLNELLK
jgi:predicted DNA-binding protein with PD1-like motif